MKASNLLIASTALATGAVLACNGLGGGSFSCPTQQAAYEDASSQEGILLEEIPGDGPYPMAMVISQDGVNRLLASVLDQTLPPIKQNLAQGVSYTAKPELPAISFETFDDCANCVRASMAFDLGVELFGVKVDDGRGAVTVRVPIELAAKGNSSTALLAHLEEAVVEDIDLQIAGLDSNNFNIVEDALIDETRNYIRSEFGMTEVVSLDSWAIGDGDVLLAARGPIIDTTNRTILLGMHSNLNLPMATTLAQQSQLPEGVPMSLQFHPNLLLSMGQRLMTEGHIARDYDESGNTKSDGDHHVSLMQMSTADGGKLNTDFRIWRTSGGLCGFADVTSALGLQVTDSSVHVQAEDLQVSGGEGSGSFIAENQWLVSDFMQSFTEQIEFTVNYKEVSTESDTETVQPEATLVEVDGRGVTVYLDLGLGGGE